MSTPVFVSFLLFAFVSSITPGPKNLMLLSSGVRFGFFASWPHMLGVSLGFAFLVFCVAMGLNVLFTQIPLFHMGLKFLGGAYLVYLAYKIAVSAAPGESQSERNNPLGFVGAAFFQWVNPKAWIMALGAIAAFLPSHVSLWGVLLFTGVFALINLPCIAVWTAFGTQLRHWLTSPRHLRVFN